MDIANNFELILPKTDIMLSSIDAIVQICKPLEIFGITAFSHTRVYDDGSFIDIANSTDVIEYFYYKTDIYKHYTPDVSPRHFEEGFFLLSSLENNQAVKYLREDLNIDHVIVLIKKYKNHCELWNFGSSRGNTSIVNFYLNNLDILNSFANYFSEKAKRLINLYEKDKIIRIQKTPNITDIDIKRYSALRKEFMSSLKPKNFSLGSYYNNNYLTMREAECLNWCIKGKTAEEIGLIVNLSKRTVEAYLNSVKDKFNCNKQTDLIRKATELGILNFFDHLYQ